MGRFGRVRQQFEDVGFSVTQAGSLGRMEIPGEAELAFPAGVVRVTFVEPPGPPRWFIGSKPKAPALPKLVVHGAGGFERFGGRNVSRAADGTRGLAGTVEIPRPGRYRVSCPEPFHRRWDYLRMPTAAPETFLLFDLRD